MDRIRHSFFLANPHRFLGCVCAIVIFTLIPGCGTLFGKRKIEQLQSESERLLSEYRLERDRADDLDIQNRALTNRISKLERRLAVSSDGYKPGVIANQTRPVDAPRVEQRDDDWTPTARR